MKKSNRAREIYLERVKKTNWQKDEICDPPTPDAEFREIIIDELLGEGWYITMPESQSQTNTAALCEIIRMYVDEEKNSRLPFYAILGVVALAIFLIGVCVGSMLALGG